LSPAHSACSTLSLLLLFLVVNRCRAFAGTCGLIRPLRRIPLFDLRAEQWRPAMVAAPWFSVFSELFKPATPELAGLASFRCARGCAEPCISAYAARNAFHATSPSALCASSAR
jgi:hypothetical protein